VFEIDKEVLNMRNMIRWQPINRPATWNTGVDRLFNEFMGRTFREMDSETASCGSWSPAVNILESEEGIVITADLPGLKAEDVEVTVDNGVLTIKGERTLEEAAEGETYHRVERSYGSFERSFSIPNSVDPKKIEARFVNGEMTVTLPKRDESKPRSVKVKVATA
jgi:HSP20 family protein